MVGGAGWLGCPPLGLGKSPWAELLELEVFEFANSGDSASARHTSTFLESGSFGGENKFWGGDFFGTEVAVWLFFLDSQNTHQKQKRHRKSLQFIDAVDFASRKQKSSA